ncbi:RNA polymerase sigma factor [Actinoallomurus soli]|uniref:RNA polymerase sigma factor n=1 Tax=Actinoallomurus soli TaxID=2952535 RepID=UPI002093FC4A|nr:sigma-70 family RNA polymerase sigma factor [Actinoallomurus soli]MCO5968593.1 sigma-70 family RNA polymerase sigma factor [Actinoallomurus soli]
MTGDPPPDPAERFDEVFDAHFAEIHRYAAKRLGPDAAADVAAQTFLEAFRHRRRYDPARGSVRTWLFGIATKVVGRHQRTETRALRALARLGPGRDAEEHTDRTDARVSAEGLRGELAGAIAALPRGQRDVLLLVALADLSHDEVAAALGISYGTVGSRLNRARTKLRKALGGTDPMLTLEEQHG